MPFFERFLSVWVGLAIIAGVTLGLAVPGMPIGSPGMDGPAYGGRKDSYAVLLVARNGSTRVFKNYPGNKKEST